MKLLLSVFIWLAGMSTAFASPPSRQCTYTAGDVISPSCVTSNEDVMYEYMQGGVDTYSDGSITTDDILNGTISSNDMGSNAIASANITNGTIVNEDVNASAAIDFSKLGTLTSGNLLIGSAGGVPTSTAMSGDVAIVAAGTTTIQANAVVLGTDSSGNYIATLADSGNSTVTVANSGTESAAATLNVIDVNCTGCLGPTEIAALTTADLSATAAITFAQLAALTDGNILVWNSSNVAVSVNPSGDVDVSNAGAFTVQDNSVDGTDIALGSDAIGDVLYYDGTNWVRLAAGTDGKYLETNGAAAPTWTYPSKTTFFASFSVASGVTQRGIYNASEAADPEAFFVDVPFAGVLKNLYVRTNSTAANTIVAVARKGQSDQALTATIATTELAASDTSNTVTFAAGDDLSFSIMNNRVATLTIIVTAEYDAL